MGCDIHSAVQVYNGTTWDTRLVDVCTGRNYELFGILAGVRGHTSKGPICTMGVPDGFHMNSVGYIQYFDNMGTVQPYWMGHHSYCYIDYESLFNHAREVKKNRHLRDSEQLTLNRYIVEITGALIDNHLWSTVIPTRLVYGFDS